MFADSGRSCNPLDRKDPDVTLPVEKRHAGGLGIYIVKQQMDFVDYRYMNGKNEFTIGKRIPGFQP